MPNGTILHPTACIAYQVKGRFKADGQEVSIDWQLVSPADVFSSVDRPLWEALDRLGLFEGKVREGTRYPSWLKWAEEERASFPPAKERQRVWQSLTQVLSEAGRLEDWAEPGIEPGLASVMDGKRQWGGFAQAVRGRLLLLEEGMKLLTQYFPGVEDGLGTLQRGFLQGFFNWQPAILPASPGWFRRVWEGKERVYRCGRCGSAEVLTVSCQRCGMEDCAYCPHCIALGRVSACQPLLVWERGEEREEGDRAKGEASPGKALKEPEAESIQVYWQGKLTPWQEKASQALVRFVQEEGEDRFLVWAVCGAGKTEMLFDLLRLVLSRGKQVLITSPRRDVILELAPRLKTAFPTVPLSVLYAGSGERFRPARLVLATTHQVLRFNRCFDLIVIDEEDAFPYHHDPMLPQAVERALAPGGKMVYLTATPRPELKEKALRKELPHVLIPQRFHGYPLAVPRLRPVGRWRKKMEQKEVITPLAEFVRHLITAKRYAYLFVPRVRDIPLVRSYVEEVLLPRERRLAGEGLLSSTEGNGLAAEGFTVEGVHAKDPRRDEIVRRFRNHEIRLLITTTILERGVTIPYCDVAVLGSDDPVFDSAALIQMAGRAGRKEEDPVGMVWFLPEVRTRSQLEAIRQIETWNRQK